MARHRRRADDGRTGSRQVAERDAGFQPGFVTITPAILELQRALARATDFPATTTTPGIVYRFDPASGALERLSGPLGPAFLERAETVGEGRFDLGASYLHARFTRFGDESLSDFLSNRFVAVAGSLVVPQRVETRDFSVTSNVIYLSATYGVTGDADVNLLLPIYATSMDGERRFTVVGQTGRVFSSLDDSAFGPGDLLLRAKYRFLDRNTWGLAAGLTMQFPTGDDADFQGTGELFVVPSVVGSWQSERLEAHGSVGVEIGASYLSRSGVRYGVGGSFALLKRLTVLADAVGTSALTTEDVTFFPDPRLVTIRGEFNPPVEARAIAGGTACSERADPDRCGRPRGRREGHHRPGPDLVHGRDRAVDPDGCPRRGHPDRRDPVRVLTVRVSDPTSACPVLPRSADRSPDPCVPR